MSIAQPILLTRTILSLSRPTAALFPKQTPLSTLRTSQRRLFRLQSRTKSYNQTRTYASIRKPHSGHAPLKVWPFAAILFLGTLSYSLLVQSRAEPMPAIETSTPGTALPPPSTSSPTSQLPEPSTTTPAYSPETTTVIFVLGGPGAGKGTQCANLVRDFGFKHLSAGDLLRAEQNRPGSEFGALIKDNIKNGIIVPMEVTIALLQNAIRDAIDTEHARRFLIDGFPRKMDQAVKFEEVVVPSKFTLFFDCSEEEMMKRLLNRGKTSGRSDDNPESIKKRFRVFVETSMPVVEYFEKEGRVVKVDATKTAEEVYTVVKEKMVERLGAGSETKQEGTK